MKRFSLRQLRIFVTVAEFGSVTEAAEKLGRSQAAVSATIAEFEQMLGIPVFIRKPAKGLILTNIGETLSLEARGLLAHADEFDAIAGAMGSAIEGEITVACFTNLAPIVFAGMVAEFRKMHPRIDVIMQVGDHETIVESIRRGIAEIAISFDLAIDDQLRSIPLAVLPPLAMVPANHRLAHKSKVTLSELANEPFILMDLPHTREYFLSLFYSLKLDPQIKFRCSSLETERAMVGNGLGYALVNVIPLVNKTYDGSTIVSIPLAEKLRPLRITMLSLKRITQRRVARTFTEFARGYMMNWRELGGFKI